MTTEYVEAAEYIKLQLSIGEIDVVVGTPLTDGPWDLVKFGKRPIRVETCAEVIAKKMWHRGHQAKARDLFDLCAVADMEPEAIARARPFMHRHANAFLDRLDQHRDLSKEEFNRIDRIDYRRPFDECLELAQELLRTN